MNRGRKTGGRGQMLCGYAASLFKKSVAMRHNCLSSARCPSQVGSLALPTPAVVFNSYMYFPKNPHGQAVV